MKAIEKIKPLWETMKNRKILSIVIALLMIGSAGIATAMVMYYQSASTSTVHVTTYQKQFSPNYIITVQGIAVGTNNTSLNPITIMNGTTPIETNAAAQSIKYSQTYASVNHNITIGLPLLTNFTTANWIEFQVTIKDTGNTYFAWNNTTNMAYAINEYPNFTGAINYQYTMAEFMNESVVNGLAPWAGTPTTYFNYLDNVTAYNAGWDNQWTNFSSQAPTIAPGSTVTFDLYVGLGADTPPNFGGQFFSFTIPMVAVVY